jgi:uncharacterized protein (TIGR02453 family)
MFQGFSKQSVDFLKALNDNNNKAWFEAHRADYDAYFMQPALDLIEALVPLAETLDPPHQAVPKLNKSLRRIHRDTRFSKDKTPYHTGIHIVLWTGDHPNKSAGTHFVLAHDHFGFGAGHWAFEGEGLDRYRSAVQNKSDIGSLEAALASAAAVGCVPGEPALKKVPRGFDADSPVADFLRRKGIVVMSQQGSGYDNRIFGPEALDYLTEILRALAPLNGWIKRVVG